MAVRPTKRPKKSSPKSLPPAASIEVEEAFINSRANAQIWEHVRRLLFYKNEEEVAAIVAEEHGKSFGAAKAIVRRVRARVTALGSHLMKTGKADQIVELHARAAEAAIMIRNERIREEKARKEKTKYSPPRNLPTEADVRALHELIARLEGNFAPAKTVQVNAFVGQDVLDLLGVQSAQEVAELIQEGLTIEAEGEAVEG